MTRFVELTRSKSDCEGKDETVWVNPDHVSWVLRAKFTGETFLAMTYVGDGDDAPFFLVVAESPEVVLERFLAARL